ncbi:mucoidy inhibitor a [Moniliophthora roreri]|nr:mucoidy inhibitor a [Moniliophthora roreri]
MLSQYISPFPRSINESISSNANIHNDSEYTFFPSIYVDGSFTVNTDIPFVSPKEHFEALLGMVPLIRITYHSTSKKTVTSRFYQKVTFILNNLWW